VIERREYEPLPPKDWALDGTSSGTGRSKQVWTWAMGKATDPGPGPDQPWKTVAAKFEAIEPVEQRHELGHCEDAGTLVVAFGSAGKFVSYVVDQLRAEGHRVGWFRPVTLWPFPGAALERAASQAKRVLVFELNAGQMVDDVRLCVPDRRLVHRIGGVSIAETGLAYGDLMDAPVIRTRILEAHT
jgi:2-oxoglutarate ferredoxin oxidoreductase subunit alpha